jgi:hypothetical protein
MTSWEKIAKILRADKDVIRVLEEKLGALTGKKHVLAKIIEENEAKIRNRLAFLGPPGYGQGNFRFPDQQERIGRRPTV